MGMAVGKTYRNKKMMDVDFHVVREGSRFLEGWWVLRRNGAFLGRRSDLLEKCRIVASDWAEVSP